MFIPKCTIADFCGCLLMTYLALIHKTEIINRKVLHNTRMIIKPIVKNLY